MQRLFWLLVGLELCGADWTVTSGSCRVDDDGCLQSPRYPSNYRNSQTCEIQVQSGNAKKISVDSFETEAGYDILQVNGQQFSGNIAPHAIVPSGTIRWSSDYSITAGGWRLCLQDMCAEKITGKGEDYRGCQTETRSGVTCQRWDVNEPHDKGIFNPSTYPDADLRQNYCRNPGGWGETIWCFTTDPDIRWQYCDHLPLWTLDNGDCATDRACSRSPNFPSAYSNSQECQLQLGSRAQGGILQVKHFETESGYDILTVDGSQFSGNAGPPAQEIGSDMQISWVSDHSVTNSGWEICVVFLESEVISTTSATQTSSTFTTHTTSVTTRTITFSTTLVSNRSLKGQLFLGVADPAAAEAAFVSEAGSLALRQGIADPFDELDPDAIELLGVAVASAARRLSSAGQVIVDYMATVALGAALDHSLLSSSSSALIQSINQALSSAGIGITVSSALHVELTTTITATTTATRTFSTTLTSTRTTSTSTTTATPVNCQFSDWSAWGKCNRPCNGGNQTRVRTVAVPEQNGGLQCVGENEEVSTCNTQNCSQCVPGYHLVFVSNEVASCLPCERGRYNPVASSDSSGACRPCERGEESFGGATECTPCSSGSAATPQLTSVVAAMDANEQQLFGLVDASMELQGSLGSLTFQASCATIPQVNFTVEVWLASTQSIDLELQLGSRAPVGWSFNVVQGVWQTTDASPQITIPRGESLVRLWASSPGLRIRSLTMQFQNVPDECGFVPGAQELWTCSRCAPGSFADVTGLTECKQCQAGTYSSDSGSSVCEACKPGSFGNRSGATDFDVCQDCPEGFFSNISGLSECEPCAAGTFSNQSGGRSSDMCFQCLPGSDSEPGSSSCTDCDAGRFADIGDARCMPCPSGEIAASKGSSSCTNCSAGTYAENGTACTACPTGSFSTAVAAGSPDDCQACPAGTFSAIRGADSISQCLGCTAGSFSTPGSSACEECSPGNISGFSAAACEPCALGSFAALSGMSICQPCPRGTHGHNDSSFCLECPAGSYSEAQGATGSETCIPCPRGTASQWIGAASLLTCEPCLPGLAADAGSIECSSCQPGTYSTPEKVCQPCPMGQYSSYFGQTECAECLLGTFNDQNEYPTSECQACPIGSFLNFRGGTALADCQECPAGTNGWKQGMDECEACPAGSVSRVDGSSTCEACPPMSDSPEGSLACCPSEHLEMWGALGAASLSLAPGKSRSEVYYDNTPGGCDSVTVEGASLLQDGQTFPGQVKLVTMGQDTVHSCVQLACNEEDQALCSLRVVLEGREDFGTGETLQVYALIETARAGTHVCANNAQVVFEGFGCAPNTLQFFLFALSIVVSATVLLGLAFELIGNCRLLILVECSFSIKLPKMWASHIQPHVADDLQPVSKIERVEVKPAPSASAPRRLSERESELVVAEEVPLPGLKGPSDYEDESLSIRWKDSAEAEEAGAAPSVPRARSSLLDHSDVLLEPSEIKLVHSASHGAVDKAEDEEQESRSSLVWPSQAALKQSLLQELRIDPRRLAYFSAWTVKLEESPMLQVEYAVRVQKGQHLELRQQLSQCKWRMAASLPSPWNQATVQQQPPAFIKAPGRAPGMDLLDFVERLATRLTGTKKQDEDAQQLQQLHLEVARHLLRKLTSREARIFLGVQYFCNLCAAAFLPFAGYHMMTSCDAGFPAYIHGAWFLYMCITNLMSFTLLRFISGEHAAAFCYRFRGRLLFRAVCSFILLTDTYQDATFPVIANRCNFELWFVSAWLVGLGVGLMQVLVQLLVIASCAHNYQKATTPEERDRLLVQGAFIALRGSDNLVLVYAVRPAVEERLGGSSSWAMKLSEARIALLRFIFEDVEQSALQAVFLIFYDEAAIFDKLWVTASILTSLLLSFTIVVQCMPEVRDWLWYRVFASFPGGRGIPLLRVFWFILVLLIYRCLSAFPWISACSPAGDPCQTREWWEFYWGCVDDRSTLLWLEARIKVVEETIRNSTIGVLIILSTVTLATIVWWARQKCLSIYQRMKLDTMESYNFLKRVQPHQDAPLRPLLEADDDLWLDVCRQLHGVLAKRLKAQLPTPKVRQVQRLLVSLEAIDRNAFTVSRAHLGGWSFPGYHWYLCRQLPKTLNKFVDLANSLQLPNDVMTNVYLFRTTVSHAVRVAKVRRHVRQLLSNRHFIKASLERKALWILECPDTPPLRLLHWSEISQAGILPKYQSSGAAKPLEQILDDVAQRQSVPREAAEQRLVVFLLSHRWLRTTDAEYHPDSEDNIKAGKLVSFARWFMRLAEAAGVPCEVAFWIDYCCCEQEDRFGMDLAMAALPLYIACCTKVVVWRTPDFDRRCWTMVERLLSYSFCSGGLTPYVIDASFEDEDAEEDEEDETPPSAVHFSSIWEVCLDDQHWMPFDDYAQAILRSAKGAGLPRSEVTSVGRRYEIDLKQMCQKNKETGKQRPVRERMVDGERAKSLKEAEPGLTSRKGTRTSQKSQTANVMQDRIQRMAKKLPNPLDPETCLLSRESHRRHISSLVSVAMQVPAFEVFADRQPVEWGLSEVVEHSLINQEPLPKDDGISSDWLELCAGRVGPNAPTTSWWRLLVLEPGSRTRHVDPLSDMDVIVWVDHGAVPTKPPPSPEELEQLFEDVDMAIDQGTSIEREECIKELILALKADLTAAVDSNDEAQMEAAIVRAREVEMPAKTSALSCLVTSRLLAAAESGSEAEMRNALRFAREKGMEKLGVYKEVLALQQGLYGHQLKLRLERLASEEADFAQLAAVHHTALSHGLEDLARQVLAAGETRLHQVVGLDTEEALQKSLQLRDEAKACGWSAMGEKADVQVLRLTMELALVRSELSDDMATLRAVEMRARKENFTELAERAARKVNETARKVGEKMGLPAGWDVVERMAGTDAARLLKKDEETGHALLKTVQELVDATFWGWGGHGAKTRTRDRGTEPVAKKLKVMSVIYVQNAEVYVNYRARRDEISASMTAEMATGDAWDIKTAAVPLLGGRLKDNPVDSAINEYYLWHGCKPEAAEGITDANFDLKRAGSAYGSLFGPGIYLAESCMKADEYTSPDVRGYFPLLLCRTALGNINYCDHPSPVSISPSLVASCKAGGGFHSVLGDREKVNGTFREFIVFDNHQVYPEYIVWYQRQF